MTTCEEIIMAPEAELGPAGMGEEFVDSTLTSAYRDIVLLNSAAALMVAGEADDIKAGAKIAAKAIDSGAARETLNNGTIYPVAAPLVLRAAVMGADGTTAPSNRITVGAIGVGMMGRGHFRILAGYPVVDVKVTLFDGSYHDVDSSEMAFKIAGSMGFRDGAAKARPALLEPVMKVEVVTPEEYMGDVMGDLNRRRGILQGMDDGPAGKIIRAEVPLAEMFGYATDLRSATQGRATYSMEFGKYAEAPNNVAEEVIKKAS